MSGLSREDLGRQLSRLGLSDSAVIAHASLKAFGAVQGGAATLLLATLDSVASLMMPAFTYRSMITPGVGPANNAVVYGAGSDSNAAAIAFTADQPADAAMGAMAEAVRRHPLARRTPHPIQSFAGIHAEKYLAAQTLQNPLGPIGALAEADGWVLLLGVDHTVNTSIHYAERLAGRVQFVRWALVPDRILECPGFPGDSAGFDAIAPDLVNETRNVNVDHARVQAVPLKALFRAVQERMAEDPLALLCVRPDCPRCNAVRESVSGAAVVA